MTFFEPPASPPERPPSYRQPPWLRAPWGEIPALVPVWLPLAETATVTFGVSCFEVYSTGCTIVVKGFARHSDPERAHRHAGLATLGHGMRLGVIWSDGIQISSDARPEPRNAEKAHAARRRYGRWWGLLPGDERGILDVAAAPCR